MSTPEAELDGFLARFTPAIADQATTVISTLRAQLPGASLLVYDNYNALAVGFGPNDKTRAIAFSIAVYPRWVSLFLAGGPYLDDPHSLLKGEGTTVRHVVLKSAADIKDPRIVALIGQTLDRCEPPMPPNGGRVVIKAVSAKQRPRRPR